MQLLFHTQLQFSEVAFININAILFMPVWLLNKELVASLKVVLGRVLFGWLAWVLTFSIPSDFLSWKRRRSMRAALLRSRIIVYEFYLRAVRFPRSWRVIFDVL